MFKHFLITRYNLHIPNWLSTKNNELIDDQWMDHRLHLFSNYCYPSVVNQTNQHFIWLIFLNMDTKEKHKKELSELIRDHSNFELVFTDGYRNFLVCLRKTISERITDEKFLITTRLDNDDCIRNDYVQLIQQEFDRQNKCILDFPKGLSIEIEPKTRLAYRRIRLNPFISLVESIDSFQTVMNFFRHRGWEKSNAIIQTIRNVRPWMQVVHEKNKSNSFKGLFLCSRYELIKPFGLLMPADIIKPGLFKKIQHFVIVFYNRSRYRLRIILEKING